MKTTLLFSALLSLGCLTSQAQAPAAKVLMKALAPTSVKKAATSNAQKVPTHSWTWDYDGMRNTYRYESDYTYNANGTVATELQRHHETPQKRITHTYDAVATQLPTLTTEASYDESAQTWSEEQTTYRYDVKRNDAGQVVQMVSYEEKDNWTLEPETTVDITYTADGQPDVVTLTTDYDLSSEIVVTFSDITWTSDDSQQMAELGDMFSLISGGKQVESATMGLSMMGLPLSGPLTVTYAESGDITANANLGYMGTTILSIDITQTTTDAYGSYQLDASISGMGQNGYSRTVVTIDDHGNVTQTDEYDGTTADDLEKTDSERTEYFYLEYVDQRAIVYYSWDETTDTYTPYLKVVYDEFTTSIQTTPEAVSGASKRIYSANGVVVGQSEENLPSGLYIVREGSTSRKLLKR